MIIMLRSSPKICFCLPAKGKHGRAFQRLGAATKEVLSHNLTMQTYDGGGTEIKPSPEDLRTLAGSHGEMQSLNWSVCNRSRPAL